VGKFLFPIELTFRKKRQFYEPPYHWLPVSRLGLNDRASSEKAVHGSHRSVAARNMQRHPPTWREKEREREKLNHICNEYISSPDFHANFSFVFSF
jgi:hypothetical protein